MVADTSVVMWIKMTWHSLILVPLHSTFVGTQGHRCAEQVVNMIRMTREDTAQAHYTDKHVINAASGSKNLVAMNM